MTNLSLGCEKKKVTIVGTEIRTPQNSKKLYLRVKANDGSSYTVNEIWTQNHVNERVTKGLWLDLDVSNQVRPSSILGKLLNTLGASSIDELVNKDLILEPKLNGFMAISS